jgi:hypothetical protein
VVILSTNGACRNLWFAVSFTELLGKEDNVAEFSLDRRSLDLVECQRMASVGGSPVWAIHDRRDERDPTFRTSRSIWYRLWRDGLATTSDLSLGIRPAFRSHLVRKYFNSDSVRRHAGDRPEDRERARDVIRYDHEPPHSASLELREHVTSTIVEPDRERQISRIEVLRYPTFVDGFIRLITPLTFGQLFNTGTIGINFFRTHSNVVSGFHHDAQPLVVIYVVSMKSQPVTNRLVRRPLVKDDPKDPHEDVAALDAALSPGQILMFDDFKYAHGVLGRLDTECVNSGGQRDALVLTMDWPDTYDIYGSPGSDEHVFGH